MKDNLYTTEGRHLKFNREYYDLGLHEKYQVIAQLPSIYFMDFVTMERIVLSILQHSPKASRNDYPCKSVRKLSLKAKLSDESYLNSQTYGLE